MSEKKLSPSGLFPFTQVDKTNGVIVLEYIVCVRWDGNRIPNLHVYFTTGPHVKLEEEEGKALVEQMIALDDYRRAILQL